MNVEARLRGLAPRGAMGGRCDHATRTASGGIRWTDPYPTRKSAAGERPDKSHRAAESGYTGLSRPSYASMGGLVEGPCGGLFKGYSFGHSPQLRVGNFGAHRQL